MGNHDEHPAFRRFRQLRCSFDIASPSTSSSSLISNIYMTFLASVNMAPSLLSRLLKSFNIFSGLARPSSDCTLLELPDHVRHLIISFCIVGLNSPVLFDVRADISALVALSCTNKELRGTVQSWFSSRKLLITQYNSIRFATLCLPPHLAHHITRIRLDGINLTTCSRARAIIAAFAGWTWLIILELDFDASLVVSKAMTSSMKEEISTLPKTTTIIESCRDIGSTEETEIQGLGTAWRIETSTGISEAEKRSCAGLMQDVRASLRDLQYSVIFGEHNISVLPSKRQTNPTALRMFNQDIATLPSLATVQASVSRRSIWRQDKLAGWTGLLHEQD